MPAVNPQHLTISADYVSAMLERAEERGFEREALLASVGIEAAAVDRGEPVSALLYGQLHHRIITSERDEWFGMLSGGAVPNGAISFLCQTMVHCKTLQQALIRCAEFFELCRGFKVKQVFEIEGDQMVLSIGKLDLLADEEFEQLMADTPANTIKSTLAAWQGFACWLVGQEIPLTALYYSFSQNEGGRASAAPYPVLYDQSLNGYRFDSKYLQYPVVQQEENIEDFLLKAPFHVFVKSTKSEHPTVQQVKTILANDIGAEFPNAPQVASRLNVSVTTLHRRLSREGASFQSIKDEARMEAAIHYLADPAISTSAIAELVGFENPSTFFRSFKKWTGLPPGEYRKRLSEN